MTHTLCLIGCGGHARMAYAPSLRRCREENVDIVYAACCDTDAQRARAFQSEAGFSRCYTDHVEMLDRERPDAVILVTPYHLTAAIMDDVLRAGCRNILLEKPPGENQEQCQRIQAAVRSAGARIAMVAFNRRHMPLVRFLMDELYNGETPMRVAHIDYRMYRHARTEDHFYSTAIHGIDLVSYLARAAYGEASITYQSIPPHPAGVHNMYLSCRMADGHATAHLNFSPCANVILERVQVIADRATFLVNLPVWGCKDAPGVIERYEQDALVYALDGNAITDGEAMFESNGFYAQLAHFFMVLQEGTATAHEIETTLSAMRLTDALARRRVVYEEYIM